MTHHAQKEPAKFFLSLRVKFSISVTKPTILINKNAIANHHLILYRRKGAIGLYIV